MKYLVISLIAVSVVCIFLTMILFKPSKSHDMNYKEGLFYPFFFSLCAYVTLSIASFIYMIF